ncbi:1-phosphatidylinositol 4,5-bisphosphate phosphodiesterase delta-4 [Rhizophlyctis rosea]|nr:1-phosphatidylinositol 4,5-bisphosphate phosphodiesterase delta-4 [Rhizophlyctis rosea]
MTFDSTSLAILTGSSPPPSIVAPPEKLQSILTRGTKMIKYPNKASSKPKEKFVKVDLMPLQISWESKKKKSLCTVDLHSIREIRLGQNTKAFDAQGKRNDLENRSFSVIYVVDGEYKSLNLVAPSREIYELWVSGLYMLMSQQTPDDEPGRLNSSLTNWLRKQWQEVDHKNVGKLDLDDVTTLFRKLNIKLSKSEIKSAFKNANINRLGMISFPAFERLHGVLRFRPEISELFASLSKTKPSVITIDEFRNFVYNTQKVTWPEERCLEIYRKYTPSEGGQMDMNHFSAFMISNNNAFFKKVHTEVCMDMSQPLNQYFINTSHNTYLLGDQLTGESSVEGYIRALQRGCRCVELDCYDGPNGPRVYHGSTLVTRLLFKDVIEAIAKYAFVASSYPLIISLETHCSIEQQNMMARILREWFGDMLCTKPVTDDGVLPSPQQLRGMVLIKAKVGAVGEISEMEEEEDSDEDDDVSPLLPSSGAMDPTRKPMPMPAPVRKILSSSNVQQEEPVSIGGDTVEATAAPTQSQTTVAVASTVPDGGVRRKRSVPKVENRVSGGLSPKLSELVVYCKGRRFAGVDRGPEFYRFDQICSLSEGKSAALLQRQRKEYIEHNKRILTRVYPAGIRVTSTNYDPLPHWLAGAQLVAVNYQTVDKGWQLNNAMFALNGRSGYVLKPSWLRTGEKKAKVPVMLSVKVISAQQLPKPKDAGGSAIIDPFVEVEVCGTEADSGKFRTKYVNNNGFNPQWKEDFRFMITEPEVAFLRFQVFDRDSLANDFVGYHVIAIQSLEEGYRHVPLYDWKGELVRFSTLFVCINLRPVSPTPVVAKADVGVPGASSAVPRPVESGEQPAVKTPTERPPVLYETYASGMGGVAGGVIVTAPGTGRVREMGGGGDGGSGGVVPAGEGRPKEVTGGPMPQAGQVAGVPAVQHASGPVRDYAAPVPPAAPVTETVGDGGGGILSPETPPSPVTGKGFVMPVPTVPVVDPGRAAGVGGDDVKPT